MMILPCCAYNLNGSLDTTFTRDGIAPRTSGTVTPAAWRSIDAKIVVAGVQDFAVVRFMGSVTTSPEITVLSSGASIRDGDSTPSLGDGTDYRYATLGGATVSRIFTVHNDGVLTLTLGAVTVPAGFTVTDGLSASLAPGASDTFTVQLDTAVAGIKIGYASFSTNDEMRTRSTSRLPGWCWKGTWPWARPRGFDELPGISVLERDGWQYRQPLVQEFSDNEWIYVDLGSVCAITRVALRDTAYAKSFAIQISNDASTWSHFYGISGNDDGVDDMKPGPVFFARYVRMLGSERATAYGYSLWEFEVYGAALPEIVVEGEGISITDGDTTTSATDGTDFGSVTQGAAAISRVFTVRNDDAGALTLGSIVVPTGFTLTDGLVSSLAPGASDTFTVQLDTATVGTKSGEISFGTSDPDENPFDFTISGTVQASGPEIAVLGYGTSIADGDTTPSTADGTDFGSVVHGEPAVSHTFTVRNEGGLVLTLGAMTMPAGFTLTELASSLAQASDTFTVCWDGHAGDHERREHLRRQRRRREPVQLHDHGNGGDSGGDHGDGQRDRDCGWRRDPWRGRRHGLRQRAARGLGNQPDLHGSQ
jgi:hypothetical protein